MSAGFGRREAVYGRGFILKRLEDRVQLGELQKIMHALGEVQQLYLAPAVVIVVCAAISSPIPELSM